MSETMFAVLEPRGVLYGTLTAPRYQTSSDIEWLNILNKPFITVGENLKVVNGALAVDTVDEVGDFTKPVTASAVNTQIGNIEVLLQSI